MANYDIIGNIAVLRTEKLNKKEIQKEIAEDMKEYEKTGGIDYSEYRKNRMKKGAADVPS